MEAVIDFTWLILGLCSIAGGLFAVKIVTGHQDSRSKVLKAKLKDMEDYLLFQKKQTQIYKNKVSNSERPPQIEGDIGELDAILPDILGDFKHLAPKWLQPLLGNSDMQKWLMDYIGKNPEKAGELFGKIVKKATPKGISGSTDQQVAAL